jgi:hypothetical protein
VSRETGESTNGRNKRVETEHRLPAWSELPWESIDGSSLSAQPFGELALIEVLLHGWEVAGATGQQVEVSSVLGAELHRCVAETAEQGRKFHAYGPEVAVADHTSDFNKALGLAGRDPTWHC